MTVRLLLAAFAMVGCGGESIPGADDQPELSCTAPRPGCPSVEACDAGECLDMPVYECDPSTGQWVDSDVICEGVYVPVEGDLHLEQAFTGTTCGPLLPRTPLVLFVQDDGSVTGPPPVAIGASDASGGWELGTVQVTLADDWGDVRATVEYALDVFPGGDVDGSAHVTTADCAGDLAVTGALCPRGAEPCTTDDGGWSVRCWAGVVHADDLTSYRYCAPGTDDEVCAIGGPGNAAPVATCSGACADSDAHWFETLDEYAAFDPASLCAP